LESPFFRPAAPVNAKARKGMPGTQRNGGDFAPAVHPAGAFGEPPQKTAMPAARGANPKDGRASLAHFI